MSTPLKMLEHCPGSLDLALFAEGKLDPEKRAAVMAHVSRCAECRLAVETAVELAADENTEVAADDTNRGTARWWIPAAAAVVIGIALFPVGREWVQARPLAKLADAAPTIERTIRPRVTGFPHAPMKRTMRGGSPEDTELEKQLAQERFVAEAGEVLANVHDGKSAPQRHAAGVAYMIRGDLLNAIAALEEASQLQPRNARVFSDLAAAYYQLLIRPGGEAYWPKAHRAALTAIQLDPKNAAAHFNYALILEQINSPQTRQAWETYLALEKDDAWRAEARTHLEMLDEPISDGNLRQVIEHAANVLHTRGDAVPLIELTRSHPLDVRSWGEGPFLTRWAKAQQENRPDEAQRWLDVTRVIGSTLASRNGELLLSDAVESVERVRGDSARVAALAEAQVAYDEGRLLLSRQQPTEAEQSLRRAATLFEQSGSPMARAASCYLATALFKQSRIPDAVAVATTARAAIDPDRHRALHGLLEWQLGACALHRGMWTAALRHHETAHEVYAKLGEVAHVAFLETIIADIYTEVAQIDRGWEWRTRGIASLSRVQGEGLGPALTGAVSAEIARNEWESALALTSMSIDYARSIGQWTQLAESLLRRVNIQLRIRSEDEALASVAEARDASAAIKDESLRNRINADVNVAEAAAMLRVKPRRAIELLDSAIAFYRTKGVDAWLPPAYLERGRAWRRAGDDALALASLEAGIRELENQRAKVDTGMRARFFDSEPELFAEKADLLVATGDVQGAFVTVERARGRTLTEQLHLAQPIATTSAAAIQQALPPGHVVVEYALLPSSLAIFCVDARNIHVATVPIARDQARTIVANLDYAIRKSRSQAVIDEAASAAWRVLIAPIANRIREAKTITFVPEQFLHAVPFAVLRDPGSGRYLIEQHLLTVSPAASLMRIQPRALQTSATLIVGDPRDADGSEELPAARREAQALGAMYKPAKVLVGTAATRRAFLNAAAESSLIHYAGHARAAGRLVLADEANAAGDLDASEIALLKLPRTAVVILAGCSTSAGEASIEAVPSIANAFLATGVPNVIGTLWDVPDQDAATFFRRFHERLREGVSPAAALAETQRALLRSRQSDASVWAAAQLVGLGS